MSITSSSPVGAAVVLILVEEEVLVVSARVSFL